MTTGKVHYIPHHCVKKTSATIPIRAWYMTAAADNPDGLPPSLNEYLLQGPDFLNNLCSILLRFRMHTSAMSTDNEKAFLHVHLHEKDKDFTRFFWLANPSDPESKLMIQCFKTIILEALSSPFMLYVTLYHHLQQHSTTLSSDIQTNLYVDNVISGRATEADAVQYYHDARTILSEAGFKLRAWMANISNFVSSLSRIRPLIPVLQAMS